MDSGNHLSTPYFINSAERSSSGDLDTCPTDAMRLESSHKLGGQGSQRWSNETTTFQLDSIIMPDLNEYQTIKSDFTTNVQTPSF
jgi:hypothetical protein